VFRAALVEALKIEDGPTVKAVDLPPGSNTKNADGAMHAKRKKWFCCRRKGTPKQGGYNFSQKSKVIHSHPNCALPLAG
jgi:hypothetical protein